MAERDTRFDGVTGDLESLILGVLVLYLDATGGLTHRRLRDVAAVRGLLSAGRVSALLMRLQMIGYVQAGKYDTPGTQKIYRPTPQMAAAFHARFRVDLESIQMMASGMGDMLARFDEPEGFGAFMVTFGRYVLAAVNRGIHRSGAGAEGMLAIERIGASRAGYKVLFILQDAAAREAGHFPATGRVRLSVAALAKRCRVSRTHILRILRMAEASEFLVRHGEGEMEVLPALPDALERFYAEMFIVIAACADRSLRGSPAVETV
jgi:hypothetical protein